MRRPKASVSVKANGLVQQSDSRAGTGFCAYEDNVNVVALENLGNGTEPARYEYGPFAEPIRVTGPAAALNPFRFSTKRTCNTTELVLYEYRAYSPSSGRWLSRDPIGEVDDDHIDQFNAIYWNPHLWVSLNIKDLLFIVPALELEWNWNFVRHWINLYSFVYNAPGMYWDNLGLFGDGDAVFKGHKDFSNLAECPFDYTLEDKGWTGPWADPERHFRPLGQSEGDARLAIMICSRDLFQRALHRGQDYFTHYGKGYVWEPGNIFQKCFGFGHICHGAKPDQDNKAWDTADKWTQKWLRAWKAACCGCGR